LNQPANQAAERKLQSGVTSENQDSQGLRRERMCRSRSWQHELRWTAEDRTEMWRSTTTF